MAFGHMETEHPENKPVFTAPSPIESDPVVIEARRKRWIGDFPQVKGFSQERMDEIYSTLDIAHYALGKSREDIRRELDEIAQGIPEMKRARACEREDEARGLTGIRREEAEKDVTMLRASADKFAAMDARDDRMRRAVMLQFTQRIKSDLPAVDQRVSAISPALYDTYKTTFNKAAHEYGRGPRSVRDMEEAAEKSVDITMRDARIGDAVEASDDETPDPRGVDDSGDDMPDLREHGLGIADGFAKARTLFISCAVEAEGNLEIAVNSFRDMVMGDVQERGHRGDPALENIRALGGSSWRGDSDDGGKVLRSGAGNNGVTAKPTGIVPLDNELLYTPTYEKIKIDKEDRAEQMAGNRYLQALPIIAADKLNDLDYATYRVAIDNEHLLNWKQTEQGISVRAKSLSKLDDGNTIAKVMKDEFGYEHTRGASLQIQNMLKKLNALMAEVHLDAVEPTMNVIDRAGTPTKDLTRRIREKKGLE
ncbi:hypothetical protein HF289_00425 [Acidithiobacillus ferrooxidans]|uniref:hypothetical protein n=1 Tax=Acidithiobacillus ferrooxidans TaxID=920 RepID=UPI001C07150E|nr:hypothetical protein [Acidithiobacillus ferrooxidans]MBU2855393.1 hypothetical protein [Acidithiobacillus ferrooxidans]